MYGAVACGPGCRGLVIGLVSLYARQREDTVIGALWAVGMAVGMLFFAKTPGYTDPMSYLFGDILLISPRRRVDWCGPGRAGGRRWGWRSTTSSWPSASTRSSPNCAACTSRSITCSCCA